MSYQDEIQLRQENDDLKKTVEELKSGNAITADQKLRKWALVLAGGNLDRADRYVTYVKDGGVS